MLNTVIIEDMKKGESLMILVSSSLHRVFLTAVSIGALALASAPSARAVPTITISDGKKKDTRTLTDVSGLMSFNGSVGKFTLSISANPATGLAMLPSLSLNSLSYGGGKKGGTLTISISDTSVHPNDGSISSQISGQTTGTVSYSTFVDTSNSLFGKGTLLGSQGGLKGAFNINGSAIVASQNAFSLTEMFVIQLGKGGSTHFGATVLDPPIGGGDVATVPDTGTTFSFLGLSLMGLAFFRRKIPA
jgi:VPDSG-CTERM motif